MILPVLILLGGLIVIQQGIIFENNKIIKKMNKKIDAISSKLEIGDNLLLSEEVKEELIKLIKEDKKVKAIKRYREETFEGLAEAKKFIDELEYSLR